MTSAVGNNGTNFNNLLNKLPNYGNEEREILEEARQISITNGKLSNEAKRTSGIIAAAGRYQ